MILNDRQKRVLSKGVAVANDVLQKVEYIEKFAAAVPELQSRAEQVRAKRDFLLHVCQTGLDIDRAMGGS